MQNHPHAPGRRSATLHRVFAPWTIVLVVTGIFHLLRGAPIDATFFLAASAVVIADALGWVRVRLPEIKPRHSGALMGLTAVLGILLVLAQRHGPVEGLVVSAIGVGVFVLGWGSDRSKGDSSPALRRALVLFTAVGVVGCLIEVTSYLLGLASPAAMFEHPSISLLLDPLVDELPGRGIFTALWLAAGVWFLRSARSRRVS